MTAIYVMLAYLGAFLIARHRLALEAVALRQRFAVYKRKQPRPKLNRFDRLFWVVVRQIWTAASTAQHRPRPGLTAPGFIAQALPALRGAGVERGMAHFSYASPDRKWVLVIEMDHTGAWQRCRLFPLDRSAVGVAVGPPGHCTATAWSPDGRWMYLTGGSASSGDHLWRQRFGKAEPEQVTFGPTEEQGIAAAPDGR